MTMLMVTLRALNRTSTQLELSSACMNLIKQKAKPATNNRKWCEWKSDRQRCVLE